MAISMMIAGMILAIPSEGHSADYVIYSVYKALDLGNPGETPQRDFYVNVGSSQGVREGTILEVVRHASTYDLMTEKLYREVSYPIARIKVIHSEDNVAIARLDRLLPAEKTPATTPRAVMIGDLVRIAE